MKFLTLLLLALLFSGCSSVSHDQPEPAVNYQISRSEPEQFDLGVDQKLPELMDRLTGKRVVFIGEVHDRLEHHQNQLRIIQGLFERNRDLAIGVEYFQQSCQPVLDDYIAGRIDERQMLNGTEYFQRWNLDYRLLRPIFLFARENHIPLLALNVSSEIHNKVFKGGMKSLSPMELEQTPAGIQPASIHYRQRLQEIFDSHPSNTNFEYFVEGVVLWDESMADTAVRHLKSHPGSRMVVLAGMSHIMYGDGIPERVNRRLGSRQSAVVINGSDFGSFSGIADYLLVTGSGAQLPKPGLLGVTITDDADGVLITEFASGSAAQATGISVGDRFVAMNGVKVSNVVEVKSLMFDKLPGDLVQIDVLRKMGEGTGKLMQFEVQLR